MKNRLFKLMAMMMVLAMVLAFAGCGSSETAKEDTDEKTEETVDDADDKDDADDNDDADDVDEAFPGAKYGYNGSDPVEMAVYEYIVDEIGDNYDDADACIPVVHIIHVDYTDEKDIKVYGDYQIDNYNIEGDTLKCVSGGDYPGCMHVEKESDDEYEVTKFDAVEDGSNNTESAKKIFGDHYKDYAAYHSDQDAKDEDRYYAVMDYVNMNEIPCTKFQDEGWDPVELHL